MGRRWGPAPAVAVLVILAKVGVFAVSGFSCPAVFEHVDGVAALSEDASGDAARAASFERVLVDCPGHRPVDPTSALAITQGRQNVRLWRASDQSRSRYDSVVDNSINPSTRRFSRGFALMTQRWQTLQDVISPSRIGEIAHLTDRKITQRKWARGSGPGPGAVVGPGQERYGLSGLGEGDGEAERLDLPDVVAELAVGIGAGLVVAGAEVGEPGGRVG